MAEASRLDAQHDDLVRNIHNSLTVLAKVSKAGDEHLRLRDLLFPEGLRTTNRATVPRGKAWSSHRRTPSSR
jgi:hypothetical protein